MVIYSVLYGHIHCFIWSYTVFYMVIYTVLYDGIEHILDMYNIHDSHEGINASGTQLFK